MHKISNLGRVYSGLRTCANMCERVRRMMRTEKRLHAKILLDGYRISRSDNIAPNNCLFVNNEL